MPPIPDRKLEERILNVAQRLWRTRGDKGLTLRAVAREARTTTPTLYKRFQNKKALRLALSLRVRDEMNAELFSSPRLEDVYRRYLRYAEQHPHEYELLQLAWAPYVLVPGNNRPGRTWVLSQLAARFGGEPDEYAQFFDTLFLTCHGAATVLVATEDARARQTIRDNCIRACDSLMEHVHIFLDSRKPARPRA
ncbi:MAG TPA: helix-turn-helix domain-containing protein [Terriglobales bacterium]|nr:helix-turn-helix domain-containing protein [Terriglobales bacterium]